MGAKLLKTSNLYNYVLLSLIPLNIIPGLAFFLSIFAVFEKFSSITGVLYTIIGGIIIFVSVNLNESDSPIKLTVKSDADPMTIKVPESAECPVQIASDSELNIMDIANRLLYPGESIEVTKKNGKFLVSGAITETFDTETTSIICREKNESYSISPKTKQVSLDRVLNKTSEPTPKENTEVSKKSEQGISPVAGIILGITVVVAAFTLLILPVILIRTTPFSFEPYLTQLIGISFGGRIVEFLLTKKFVEMDKENQLNITSMSRSTNTDRELEFVEVDRKFSADLIYEENFIVSPNGSDPRNWEQSTTITSSGESVKFAFGDYVHDKEIKGSELFSGEIYTDCNAKFDELNYITVYDSEYNKVTEVDLKRL